MKRLLKKILQAGVVAGALLLLTRPALAQEPLVPAPTATAAGEAPAMLADVEDEVRTAQLKLLRRHAVTLPPPAGRNADIITLEAEGLSFRLSLTEAARARSSSATVQQKYGRAVQQLRKLLKEKRTTLALNQPGTRDVEHLLAAWALPAGRVAGIMWQGQPLNAYTIERYGGGPNKANQAKYPEGQVFYCYATERPAGFYVYMNVPKTK